MDEYESVKKMVENLIILQDKALIYVEHDINNFIKFKMKNDVIAERFFDKLLDMFQTQRVLDLYKKLGEYYYNINPKLVEDYMKIYNEFYLNDKDEKIKKK